MPIYQAFNRRTNAWVKYEFGKNGFRVLDVKQKEPNKPFKGVKKRGQKMKDWLIFFIIKKLVIKWKKWVVKK